MSALARTPVAAGPTVPLAALRVALVAAACVGFAVAPPPYAVAAVAIAIVAALLPAGLLAWVAAGIIALALLAHPASVADPRPYLAVAAVHLLQVLGALTVALPVRGRLQVRALARPARRFLILESAAQSLLALVLWVRPGVGGSVAAGAVAIAVAACVVSAVLLVRALARRR